MRQAVVARQWSASDIGLVILPVLAAVAFAARTHGAPGLTGDSSGYMFFHATRPVGYPAFLWVVSRIAPAYSALVPVQFALLALSIAAIGLAMRRVTGRLWIAVLVQLMAVANPAYWSSASVIMSEALSATTLNLFCAVLLLHVRAARPWTPWAYGLICLVGISLRPVNIAMGPAAILALVLLASGGWSQRLRSSILPALVVMAGVIVGYVATPVAQRLVHHEAAAPNPLARGLLQKVMFHDWPATAVAGVDPEDQAIIESSARPVRAYLDQAPAGVRAALERPYSDYLRFQVILPALAARHRVDAEWRIDQVLYRYVTARVSQHPMAFATDVLTEDLRLLSYQGYYDGRHTAQAAAFLRLHPPVTLPVPPATPEGIALDNRARRSLNLTGASAPAPSLATRLKPAATRPWPLILGQRLFHGLAAVLGLVCLVIALIVPRGGGWRRPVAALAALGVLLHAETALTSLSEFGLLRYISPFWAVLCAFYGLCAWIVILIAKRESSIAA